MTRKILVPIAIVAIAATMLGTIPTMAATSPSAPWITDLTNVQTQLQSQISTLTTNLNTDFAASKTYTDQQISSEASTRTQSDAALTNQINTLSNLISNPPPKPAVVNTFLNVAGIPGESTDKDHLGDIEIDSWSFGATQSTTIGSATGGAGSGKVSFQDIHFTTKIDKASPKLFLACATGEHISDATLFLRKPGSSFDYMQIKLTDVLVSSYQTGGSGSSDTPMESFSLNFAKVQITFTSQNPDGTAGAPTTGGWDLIGNLKL